MKGGGARIEMGAAKLMKGHDKRQKGSERMGPWRDVDIRERLNARKQIKEK